jgi:hypothetical protein
MDGQVKFQVRRNSAVGDREGGAKIKWMKVVVRYVTCSFPVQIRDRFFVSRSATPINEEKREKKKKKKKRRRRRRRRRGKRKKKKKKKERKERTENWKR